MALPGRTPKPQPSPSNHRVATLDGVRALAIGGVMGYHFRIFGGGSIGVTVFFVLSGYLITGLLLRPGALRRPALLRFYARRLMRLYPALVVLCVFCSAFALLVLSGHQRHFMLVEVGTSLSYTTDFYFAHGRVTRDWGYLGQTWSLAVEEQYYLLWPVLLMAILRFSKTLRARIGWVAALAVVIIVWRAHLAAEGLSAHIGVGFDTQSDALLVGCILALGLPTWRDWLAKHQLTLDIAAAVALCTLIAFILSGEPMWVIPYRLGYVLASLAAAVLIGRLVLPADQYAGHALKRLFAMPIATFTGRISYSLYLWQPVLTGILTHNLHISSGWKLDLAGGPVVALLFAVAYASWRWVEQPFQRLKDRRLVVPLAPSRGAPPTPRHDAGAVATP